MSRRSLAKPSDGHEGGLQKPTLEALLDHYGIDYVPFKTSQMIRCFLHEDNTPSCSVNTDKQVWNCKSCGHGGDAFTLIELREETDFDGARAYVAAQSIPTGDAGGGDSDLRVGRYGRRGSVAPRPRNRPGDGGYQPSWRRR